jgi:hypothetical protein
MPRGNLATLRGNQIVDFARAGLSTATYRAIGQSGPPQQGSAPFVTHNLGASPGADCPTCNLVEIPYDASLPTLNYQG